MGPQGKRRVDHRDLECAHPARALGRDGARAGPHEFGCVWKHCDQLFMVWSEHARHWLAFLWLYGRGIQVAGPFHREPGVDYSPRPDSAGILAQLPLAGFRSEEHTSELQSRRDLVCRLLLEKKKKKRKRQ